MRASTELRILLELQALADGKSISSKSSSREHAVAAYLDSEKQRAERGRLFRSLPLIVGSASEVEKPGDFITRTVCGLPVLITRSREGELKAFINVCRHRGNLLCAIESGNRKTFRCGYHSWVYDGDGRCRSFSDAQAFRDRRLEDFGLVRLGVEMRHRLIWVTPEAHEARPVAKHLGAALDEELGEMSRAGSRLFEQRVDVLPFSWKLGIETFLEVFHIGSLHRESIAPGFLRGLMSHERIGAHQRLAAARSSLPSMLAGPRSSWRLAPHATIIYFLFPNTIYIHQMDHIEMFTFFPHEDDCNSCMIRTSLLIPEGRVADRATRHWRNNWDIITKAVYDEDFEIARNIQRNIASGAAQRFLLGSSEIGIQAFHDAIDMEMTHGRRTSY